MQNERRMLLGAALAAGTIGWPALARAQGKAAAGPRKVVLGQSVPLTGAADQIGLAFAGGSKLYFDAFNARKNNPGWTFELHQMDDGYVAAKAAANAKKLLDDGADILFGFVGTASTEAAAEVATKEGAIFFAPFAASDKLRDPAHANVFHVRPSLSDEAFKMVRHCATLGQTRISVLAEDDAMGRAGLAAVQQAMGEQKLGAMVASVLVPTAGGKLDAALADVLKASPQAIVLVSLSGTTAEAIRKLRKSGYAGTFMAFSIVGIDPLYATLGKDISGIVISQVVPSAKGRGKRFVHSSASSRLRTSISV